MLNLYEFMEMKYLTVNSTIQGIAALVSSITSDGFPGLYGNEAVGVVFPINKLNTFGSGLTSASLRVNSLLRDFVIMSRIIVLRQLSATIYSWC